MPTAAQVLLATAQDVVEIGGIRFRIRRIVSEDIAAVGGGFLLAVKPLVTGSGRADTDEATAQVEAALSLDPKLAQEGNRFMRAIVAAGVSGICISGEAWEDLRVVLDPGQENGAANRVLPSALPPGAVPILGKAILALSLKREVDAERRATFLRGHAGAPGPTGGEVPHGPGVRPEVGPGAPGTGDGVPVGRRGPARPTRGADRGR